MALAICAQLAVPQAYAQKQPSETFSLEELRESLIETSFGFDLRPLEGVDPIRVEVRMAEVETREEMDAFLAQSREQELKDRAANAEFTSEVITLGQEGGIGLRKLPSHLNAREPQSLGEDDYSIHDEGERFSDRIGSRHHAEKPNHGLFRKLKAAGNKWSDRFSSLVRGVRNFKFKEWYNAAPAPDETSNRFRFRLASVRFLVSSFCMTSIHMLSEPGSSWTLALPLGILMGAMSASLTLFSKQAVKWMNGDDYLVKKARDMKAATLKAGAWLAGKLGMDPNSESLRTLNASLSKYAAKAQEWIKRGIVFMEPFLRWAFLELVFCVVLLGYTQIAGMTPAPPLVTSGVYGVLESLSLIASSFFMGSLMLARDGMAMQLPYDLSAGKETETMVKEKNELLKTGRCDERDVRRLLMIRDSLMALISMGWSIAMAFASGPDEQTAQRIFYGVGAVGFVNLIVNKAFKRKTLIYGIEKIVNRLLPLKPCSSKLSSEPKESAKLDFLKNSERIAEGVHRGRFPLWLNTRFASSYC